jgi:hypothetical protein
MMKYFQFKGLGTVELEEYASSVKRDWTNWTKPLATSHSLFSTRRRRAEKEQSNYMKTEEEIRHCAENYIIPCNCPITPYSTF